AQPTLSPSDLGGAKALAGDQGADEETAKKYGSLVHFYLEHLAGSGPDEWGGLLDALRPRDTDVQNPAAGEAMHVLSDPAHAHIFNPTTLAEVSITANLGARRIHGAIDRLIVTDTKVLAVDFKSNRVVPDAAEKCPHGLLRQMGAYAHALAQIYPDRVIETAILWTRTSELMVLPHEIVRNALHETPYLDEAGQGT
ncbi:MAG: PD-(D/E)XK nuclease family protein, partial [Sulfitobacter sp.]